MAGYDELCVEFYPIRKGEIFWMNNNSNYWMRLSMIWIIMQIQESVIRQSRRLMRISPFEGGLSSTDVWNFPPFSFRTTELTQPRPQGFSIAVTFSGDSLYLAVSWKRTWQNLQRFERKRDKRQVFEKEKERRRRKSEKEERRRRDKKNGCTLSFYNGYFGGNGLENPARYI